MKISLINSNLISKDAVGSCVLEMARYFSGCGDQVQVYIEQPAKPDPEAELTNIKSVTFGQLITDEPHFASSELLIYHYPHYYSLLESMHGASQSAVIIDYHGVTPPQFWSSDQDREMLFHGQQKSRIALYADLPVAHSPFTAHELALWSGYPEPQIAVLPLWAESGIFKPGYKDTQILQRHKLEGRRIILFVGRMAGQKRIDVLIRAFAKLSTSAQDTCLLLVGDTDAPPYREVAQSAKRLAGELKVADGRVIFTGKVDDLPAYYRIADLFVMASEHEGFCMPVVEAMACGVPVVAAAGAALPWVLGDAGRIFPAADDAALARILLDLLNNADECRTLSAKGLNRAKEFSLKAYYSQLECLRAEAIRRKGHSPKHRLSTMQEGVPVIEPGPQKESPAVSNQWHALAGAADPTIHDYQVRSDKPVIGPLYSQLRRMLTEHLREHYLDRAFRKQAQFNVLLIQELKALAEKLQGSNQQSSRFEQLGRQCTDSQAAFNRGIIELKHPTEQEFENHTTLFLSLQRRLDSMETGIVSLQETAAENRTRLEEHLKLADDSGMDMERRAQRLIKILRQLPGELQAELEHFWIEEKTPGNPPYSYLDCNMKIGGDPKIQRELYCPFLKLFAQSQPILDIGCGRGVFLQLCQENGIAASGVDLDDDMVQHCQEQGLQVRQGDAFDYLRSVPEGSLGGIFCAHLIEHLPKDAQMQLLLTCHARLCPGAPLVLITPNGGGLTIFHYTFFKDPTHIQPIHPEALRFLMEVAGFERIRLETSSGLPEEVKLRQLNSEKVPPEQAYLSGILNDNLARLNDLLFGDLDCAAIGWRSL